jgi:maltose O-acetyltransferase
MRLGGADGAPVRIGNDVWLGAMVTVLTGVSIGDGAIVGANAVLPWISSPLLSSLELPPA